jgi:hypothetical protein
VKKYIHKYLRRGLQVIKLVISLQSLNEKGTTVIRKEERESVNIDYTWRVI